MVSKFEDLKALKEMLDQGEITQREYDIVKADLFSEDVGTGEDPNESLSPGWYTNPKDEGEQRYWDGEAWADSTPLVPTPPKLSDDTEIPTPPILPNGSSPDKQPIYKRRWFIALAVILGLGFLGSLIGNDAGTAGGNVVATPTTETATDSSPTTTEVEPTTTSRVRLYSGGLLDGLSSDELTFLDSVYGNVAMVVVPPGLSLDVDQAYLGMLEAIDEAVEVFEGGIREGVMDSCVLLGLGIDTFLETLSGAELTYDEAALVLAAGAIWLGDGTLENATLSC